MTGCDCVGGGPIFVPLVDVVTLCLGCVFFIRFVLSYCSSFSSSSSSCFFLLLYSIIILNYP